MREDPKITVMTGAGVSVASGVPTFRDPGGLWEGIRPEQVATPEAFARDPLFVWKWYQVRREKSLTCLPNRGHEVLAEWSHRFSEFTLITQNVDGLHERAGTRNVIRYHGSLMDVGCWEACAKAPYRWRDDRIPFPELPPTCPYCGGLLRPGVVWFGESIDPEVIRQADLATNCDLFFTIGTSAQVYPAADLVYKAKRLGAFTVEINPESTAASSTLDLCLQGRSEIVLDQLGQELNLPQL
jgi:NAD-dependent deacetylase